MEHTHFIDREPDKYEALTELQKQHIQSMKEEQVVDMIDRFESVSWDTDSIFTLRTLTKMVILTRR